MIQKKKLKKQKKPIKVMVAVPNQGTVTCEVAKALGEMVAESFMYKKYELDLRFSRVTCVDYNRNTIVKMFLESNNKFLLMMDYDNPCLKNPLDLLEKNKDIIIYPTLMNKVNEDGEPTLSYNVFMKEGSMFRTQVMTKGKPFMEYDAGGTGCVLIKRRVLEALEAPFKSKLYKDGTRHTGSDLYFCKRAQKKGFKIWAHWEYACKHIKRMDLLDAARMIIMGVRVGESKKLLKQYGKSKSKTKSRRNVSSKKRRKNNKKKKTR